MVAVKRSPVTDDSEEASTVARLLVLGAKQVGKSAAIVRYTTGRYIQEYGHSTNHWLYRHSLSKKEDPNVDCIELLEQKDVQVSRDWTTLQQTTGRRATSIPTAANQSLSDRVALDQQLDQERVEKQETLEKLLWANAYIVIYAINDSNTFNKAIKYLNLIDNNINSASDSPKPLLASSGDSAGSCVSTTSASAVTNSNGCRCSSSSSSSSNGSITDDLASVGRSFLGIAGAHQSSQTPSGSSTGSNGACGCSTGTKTRRPILLLANKCDLEKSQRQVSTSDGRMLAIRHQSMFAELSVAETHKLLDSCLASLIEQIEPGCLHRFNFSGSRRKSSASTLTEWKPPGSLETTLYQAGSKLTAPIWASLVKCGPLSGIVVQSSASSIQSRVQRVKPQVVATLKRSHQMHKQKEPRYSTSSEPGHTLPPSAKVHKENSYLDRYESIKSSFRTKATLARNLANRHTNNDKQVIPCTLKSSSGDIKVQSEFCEPISSRNKTTNWLRSHIRGSSNQSMKKHVAVDSTLKDVKNVPETGKQKRPLFRYKNRRKTVAFEPQVNPQVSSLWVELERPEEATSISGDVELNRTSSLACGSESSSFNYGTRHSQNSISDNSSLDIPIKDNQSAGLDCTVNHSSEVQVEGGKLQQFTGNQLPETCAVQTDRLLVSTNQSGVNAGKKRYHLVKTMQATLSNFTKSPITTQSHSPNPKRSFCNSLFRSNPQGSLGSTSLKKVSQPLLNVAKVEYIRRDSTTVGFCS